VIWRIEKPCLTVLYFDMGRLYYKDKNYNSMVHGYGQPIVYSNGIVLAMLPLLAGTLSNSTACVSWY
jgi:hypothetical protein